MSPIENLLNTLKSGTREEKGHAVTELAKLKDPGAFDALREVVESEDQELASMALYTLALSGDGNATENLKTFISFFEPEISKLLSSSGSYLLQDVNLFNPGGVMDDVFKLLDRHQPEEARDKIHKLLHICKEFKLPENIPFSKFYRLGMRRTEGILKIALGMVEMQLGNMDASINFSRKALEIGEEIGEETGNGQIITVAVGNIGVAYMEMDRYYEALDYFHKSLELMEEYTDPWRKKNRILYNMSLLYLKIGNLAEAGKYADMALETARTENDPVGTAYCLIIAGSSNLLKGDYTAAEGLFLEALEYSKSNGNKQTEATVLSNIGFIYRNRGEHDKAIDTLHEALRLFKGVGNKKEAVSSLVNLAYLYMETGKIEETCSCATEALTLVGNTVGSRDSADANYILGVIEHYSNHDYEEAYDYFREAIELFEKIRKDAVLDELKIVFAENSANAYAEMVILCLETGRVDDAFEYVERSKSRALVDLLSKTIDGIHSHRLSEEKVQEIMRLKDRLSWLRNSLNQLYQGTGLIDTGRRDGRQIGDEQLEAIHNEIMETEQKYMEVYREVRRIDPEWASISKIEPFSIDEAAELLDEGTVLIEYYQTSDRLHILVIVRDGGIWTSRVETDAGKEFERLFQLLQSMGGDTVLDVRSHAFLKDVRLPLSEFYKLLIAPIEEAIKDVSRLIIVPHLFWHHLPFHALYDEERGEYLADRFEISYAPSAEVLKYCQAKNNPERRSATIFANPTGDLPYADEEARKVAACFGSGAKIFNGKDATLHNLESLEDTDIIHLACHGVFRADEPVFSHLLLADDNAGHGACFLPDIFNLRLKTPTLVAVSACESGLNIPSSGDDLIGFARGFFYAGAPSVVATLWRVNDKSTASFMEEFYNGLIHRNLTKSKALQLAIQKIKSMEEYRHPYFWAPFVLMGDWI